MREYPHDSLPLCGEKPNHPTASDHFSRPLSDPETHVTLPV
jgi:hypothetical protein